jgi:two-component system alkaline phosphatase synthesis response regulator PhoP
LDLGADDYLAKPFGMMEMISRVKAVLRRTESPAPFRVLRNGSLEMNVDEHTVSIDGNIIPLTLKEYELLYLFLTNPGRVYTRENLLSLVWNDDYLGETRTVDVHIGTLRSKLGECAGLIETVRGVGYKLGGKR